MAWVWAPKKLLYQNAQQPHNHRQIFGERRVAEMIVHVMGTAEQFFEIIHTDAEHDGQTDGAP